MCALISHPQPRITLDTMSQPDINRTKSCPKVNVICTFLTILILFVFKISPLEWN